MEPKFSKEVQQIIRLEPSASGGYTPKVIYKKETKKRKGSQFVQPMEKLFRKAIRANNRLTSDYLDRHDRSNVKKKDGWLRDMNSNLTKSYIKSIERLAP